YYFKPRERNILLEESKHLFGQAGERILPARLLLIDGATTIREKAIWKPADFNFGLTVVDRPAYVSGCPFPPLVIGYPSRAAQFVEECLLFRLDGRLLAHVFRRLCGL